MDIKQLRKIKVDLSKITPATTVIKKQFKPEVDIEGGEFDMLNGSFADYPWESCIADQIKAYGSEEIAKRVCGAIKAENSSKQEMDITPNPCWEGYEPIGLKPDGSPNCVPKKGMKGDFTIPKPEGESEQDYISKCMKAIGSEYDSQEQALAVCYAQLK